ncbi:mucin-13-like [Clinocottus analis]|uniref:mucin-13-like n=1 Tax=Clinocottus analis TaxID=304258 RepID=UPI0035C0064A
MSVSSLGLVVLWLLPLTAGQDTNVTAPAELTEDGPTAWEASSRGNVSEASPPESSTRIQTAAMSPTNSTPPRYRSPEGSESGTENPFNSTASAATTTTTTAATDDGSDRTRTMRATSTPSSSAQTPSSDEAATQPPARSTPSASPNSTPNTPTGPTETRTAGATPPPGSYTTPKEASASTAKATETRPGTKGKEKAGKGSAHSRVVAGLIGGALLVMLAGFLLIYVRKRTLRKQQMATDDWAGPSPFLEGGANDENGRVAVRSFNRISLSSLLTHRLSRRMSAAPRADEEVDAMTPASTFGGERRGSRFPREGGGAAAAGLGPDATQSNGDAPENNGDISEVQNRSADSPAGSNEAESEA